MSWRPQVSDAQPAVVLLASGALGWFGVSARGVQVAVETAHVLARVIVYPTQMPFYIICHAKSWALFVQLSAWASHPDDRSHLTLRPRLADNES